MLRGFQSRRWAWWYLSISLGFLLLAAAQLVRGAGALMIGLRILIAIGFAALAWMQWVYGR